MSFIIRLLILLSVSWLGINEAILQAAQGKDSLHIIDLGMERTLQWPSLLRSLAWRPEDHLKIQILGLIHNQNMLEIETNMNMLVQDAISSLGIALEFTWISEPIMPVVLTEENMNLREGEA